MRSNTSEGTPVVTTTDPTAVLGHISGGRVLDAATGDGQFIGFLLDGLRDHTRVIGIDRDPAEGVLFAQRFGDRSDVTFELMDVLDPRFPDGSFDTVAMAHSLCQFEDAGAVLARLTRLVRPGGHLVVAAAYRDNQDTAATTYVELHDWWAAADEAIGKVHRRDLRRHELVTLLETLALDDLRLFDVDDGGQDPFAGSVMASIDAVIDRTLGRIPTHPDLQAHGEVLRGRMRTTGFRMPITLTAVGRVPPGAA